MTDVWATLIFATGVGVLAGLVYVVHNVVDAWLSGLVTARGQRDVARGELAVARDALTQVEDVLDRYRGGQLDVVGENLSNDVRDVLRAYARGQLRR